MLKYNINTNCCSTGQKMSYSRKPTASLPCSQQPSTGKYPEPVQSSLHPTAFRFFLTVPGLSSSLIPSGFLTKILDICLTTPMHATYPTHFSLLNLTSFNIYATDHVHTEQKHYFSHYINMAYINK